MPAEWNAIDDFVLDQLFGFQTATKLKNNILALASSRITHELGGATSLGIRSATFVAVPEYRHAKINGAQLDGLTVAARVFYRTDDTGTTVDWQVVDLDAASAVVAAGTVYSADTLWQEEAQTLTLNGGDHRYQLQVKGSNANADVQAYGRIEISASA